MADDATQSEIDRLRAELDLARANLAATERECAILHTLVLADGGARQARGAITTRRVEIGSRERMAMLEHTVDVLEGFVASRASWDCYGCDYNAREPGNTEQMCEPCAARAALDRIKAWRYGGSTGTPSRRFEGALHARTTNGWNPREAKIHRAWAKHMETWGADRTLGLVLTDRLNAGSGMFDGPIDWPTPRDWYVATSVVQWLATNVGSSILEDAGWRYSGWDEDRAALDAKRDQSVTRAE